MFRKACVFAICLATCETAFAQFDAVLDKVRQGADQVNANNPTYYLKSAKAVEPNICLYSNGDPTGLIGPLVFRSSYVASPNCREFKACTDVAPPVDETKAPGRRCGDSECPLLEHEGETAEHAVRRKRVSGAHQ